MNTPIIDPILFYFVDVIPRVGAFLGFFGLGLGICGVIILVQDDRRISVFKKFLISGIVVFVVGVLFPSKDACYQMIAAKAITPNNIKTVTD